MKKKHDKTVIRLDALELATKKNAESFIKDQKRCMDELGVLERLRTRDNEMIKQITADLKEQEEDEGAPM